MTFIDSLEELSRPRELLPLVTLDKANRFESIQFKEGFGDVNQRILRGAEEDPDMV